jgi:hypothetical protein
MRCLVTGNGYNIQDIARSDVPAALEQEHRFWYQYYFHTERGRADRREPTRILPADLALWSPNWKFDDATFERTAASSTTRISSTSRSSPIATASSRRQAIPRWNRRATPVRPTIAVPTISLSSEANGVGPPEGPPAMHTSSPAHTSAKSSRSPANLPQEVPYVVSEAALELVRATI